MELSIEGSTRLRVVTRRDVMTIEARGVLDALLVRVIAAAVLAAEGDWRIEIDLGKVESHTDEGVAALALLRSCLVTDLDRAVTYRAGSESGQNALLAAYALSD